MTKRLRRWQGKEVANQKRPSVYLNHCTDPEYAVIKTHLDGLRSAKRFGRAPSDETSVWLAQLDDEFHGRIAHAGLCDPRSKYLPAAEPVVKYVAGYFTRRPKLGPRNLSNLRQTEAKLSEYFGPTKQIGAVTVGDAKGLRRKLEDEDYAQATISMHIKKARQFFGEAVDREILTRNPFLKVNAGTQVNAAKMQYVCAETVELVMAKASPRFRLILAIARYAGLRCPSELARLRWCDVHWKENWLHVFSDKTKKQSKPERYPKMSSRLRAVLVEAFKGIEDVQQLVVPGVESSANLRTQIGRYCKAAGVVAWKKSLQNLRLSCETDWMDSDGVALACKWSGNTPDVAMKHYHLVRDSDYKRGMTAGAESRAEQCGIDVQQAEPAKTTTPASEGISPGYTPMPFSSLPGVSQIVPPRGVEPLFAG